MLSRLLESLSSIAKKQRPLGSEEADAESGPPLLLDLQDELWVECILRTGKEGIDGERLGASELIRLRRVSRAGSRIVRDAKLEATVAREKARRVRAQHEDREKRKRCRSHNAVHPLAHSVLAHRRGDTSPAGHTTRTQQSF